ncbi:fimbrial protein [Cronobacter malonaticus]
MEETCGISINNASSSETITLPTLSTTVLQKAGAEAGSQQFSVTLTHCPIDKTVMLRFVNDSGLADANTGNLMNQNVLAIAKMFRSGYANQMALKCPLIMRPAHRSILSLQQEMILPTII